MNIRISIAMGTMLVAGLLQGCGAQDGMANDDVSGEESVAKTDEALSFGTWAYNTTTQCNVQGLNMHCCPGPTPANPNVPNQIMVGVNVSQNKFKCAVLNPQRSILPTLSFAQRSAGNSPNMLACPVGSVMVGYKGNSNAVACIPVSEFQFEGPDTGTQDGVMHVCPSDNLLPPPPNSAYTGWGMSGIHVGQNTFLCVH